MQKLIVWVAIVALAWMGLGSSANADSIAVSAAFLESPPALTQLSDFAPRGVGRGLALRTALLSSFAASLPPGDGFGRIQRAVRGANGSGGGVGVGGGFGGGVGAGAGVSFMGREGLGATLKPSAAAPSRFALSTPPARGATPARTRSRSHTPPPVVLSSNGLPLPSDGASAVGGAQADFAGAPAASTPEPATLILLGAGLAGAAVMRRGRREKHAAE